jgi:tetratricopeptide (TPR) repeat protein
MHEASASAGTFFSPREVNRGIVTEPYDWLKSRVRWVAAPTRLAGKARVTHDACAGFRGSRTLFSASEAWIPSSFRDRFDNNQRGTSHTYADDSVLSFPSLSRLDERSTLVGPGRFLRIALIVAWMELTLGLGMLPAQERTVFPQEARDRFDKGRDLQQKGSLQEAIQAYQDAIGLGMQAYPRAHLYQADASLQMKEYDAAITRYTQFLEKFRVEDSCRY